VEPSDYKIDVELTRGEIARYNFHHIRWLLLLDLIGLALLLGMVYVSLVNPDPGARNTLKILIMWGVLIVAVGFSQPLILFLQIFVLKTPDVQRQMQRRVYIFDNSGIHIEADGRSVTTLWSRVVAIKDVSKLFLIYTSPKLAYVIPKRYFPSRRDRLRFVRLLLSQVSSPVDQPAERK
jgi:hypothetical protein